MLCDDEMCCPTCLRSSWLDQVRDFALDVAAGASTWPVGRCPSSACTLLMQCASQQRHKLPRSDWLLALSVSRGYA